MNKCRVVQRTPKSPRYLQFILPMRGELETLQIRDQHSNERPSWEWNGSHDAPTITPSVRHLAGDAWHYYLRDGRLQVLTDSPSGAPEMLVDVPDLDDWPRGMVMALFCVYANPRDFPGKHVVRRWVDEKPSRWCYVDDSLERARRVIPRGCTRLARTVGDDPCIVETWIE